MVCCRTSVGAHPKILEKPYYRSSHEVFDFLYHSMRGLKKEIFKVLYLNSQNQINDTFDLSEGTVNSSAVSIREVIEGAVRNNAAALIFAHNHPSGDPAPSREDDDCTQRLVHAGEILGIRVLDHIVFGRNGYYSFSDSGRLKGS